MEYLLFFFFLFFILGSIVWGSIKNGISPMPTSRKAKKGIIELTKEIKAGTMIDLGSGWGTLVIALAKEHPEWIVVGYETSLIPYLVSKMRQKLSRLPNLQIHRQNLYDISLNEASIIVCYLFPDAMRKLKGKFERELSPGTIIISNTFAIPGWKPQKTLKINDLYNTTLYLYSIDISLSR